MRYPFIASLHLTLLTLARPIRRIECTTAPNQLKCSDKLPGTQGRIITYPLTHPVFAHHGLSYDKWRFREAPLHRVYGGGRTVLHIQYLHWPDGKPPPTEDSGELMTLTRLLTDPRSILLRPKGMADADAQQIDEGDFSRSRVVLSHWCVPPSASRHSTDCQEGLL